jgi:hypothetical protein
MKLFQFRQLLGFGSGKESTPHVGRQVSGRSAITGLLSVPIFELGMG